MQIVNVLVNEGKLDDGTDGAELRITVSGTLPKDMTRAALGIAHLLLDPNKVFVLGPVSEPDGMCDGIELFRNHLN